MPVLEPHFESCGDVLRTIAVNSAYDVSRAMSKWFKQGTRVTTDGIVARSFQEILSLEDDPDEPVAAVRMRLAGDLDGQLVVTLSRESAFRLIDLSQGQPEGTSRTLGKMEKSCIRETASIIGASLLNSLSRGLKLRAELGSPVYIEDPPAAVLKPVLTEQGSGGNTVALAKIDFTLNDALVGFSLFLIPTADAYRLMIDKSNPSALAVETMKTVVINSAFKVSGSLSKWFRRGVRVTAGGFERTCLSDISESFVEMGDRDMVAVHVPVDGDLEGDVLQCFPMPAAMSLVDVLLSQPSGTATTLGEMERSGLAETANILTHSFLNSLAGEMGISSIPGPPEFLDDMSPTVLLQRLNEQTTGGDEILAARTVLIMEGTWGDWTFLFLPTPKTMDRIAARCV